jgi:hypothetical protein
MTHNVAAVATIFIIILRRMVMMMMILGLLFLLKGNIFEPFFFNLVILSTSQSH